MSVEVDFDSLLQAADRLRQGETALARGAGTTRGASVAGFPRLVAAVNGFQVTTDRRLTAARSALAGASDGVRSTTRAYQDVDAEVSEAMTRQGRSLGSTA